MNGLKLFQALSYVDDRYLDMVDVLEKENFEMNLEHKHTFGRKSLTILIAVAICISAFATTTLATGWIPGIFNAMKDAVPEDEELFNAAVQANTDAVAEVKEIPQLDFTQFTLFERFYDGETILLGYDLDSILPAPVVGYTPADKNWSGIKSGIDIGGMTSEAMIEWQNHPASESALAQNMSDSSKVMDLTFRGMLSSDEYAKAMELLQKDGYVCVMTHELWVGDHILVNGHEIAEVLSEEVWNMRYDYDVEEGSCIKINPLPEAGIDQDEVAVTLNIRSCEQYWYMDLEGNARFSTGNHETNTVEFILQNVNK